MKIELLDVEHCSTCRAEKMRGGVKYWVSGKRGKEQVEGGGVMTSVNARGRKC